LGRQIVDSQETHGWGAGVIDNLSVDLLFFHRHPQSMVAVDLKVKHFIPEYAGKMNFYLDALDDLRRLPHENPVSA
jgi:hypothetical protein